MLDLCTGIGGFSLALKWLVGGFRTVCYVEIDGYCQQVIQQRIKDGYLDDAPIWSDLKTFDGKPWRGVVDIITAGFPCQPFSVAGKQLGESDERNLWPDVGRVIREVRPRYVFLENVPGLLANRYIGRVFGDLAACGYCVQWDCISAASVGANHQRDRLWVVANPNGKRCAMYSTGPHDVQHGTRFATSNGPGPRSLQTRKQGEVSWFSNKPNVGRVVYGTTARVAKYKLEAAGSCVVPAVVAKAWDMLTG